MQGLLHWQSLMDLLSSCGYRGASGTNELTCLQELLHICNGVFLISWRLKLKMILSWMTVQPNSDLLNLNLM